MSHMRYSRRMRCVRTQVVRRYFDGDPLTVQPVGPSPAIVHVDNLKKLTPLWYRCARVTHQT